MEYCRRAIARADDLRYEDPTAAVDAALAARDAAAAVDSATRGWSRLQAYAWGVLASSYRYAGDLRRAESCLSVALAFLSDAADLYREPDLAPRLAQRASYLRCDQGRFEEALDLNRDAVAGFRGLDDEHLTGCALLDRALIHHRSGRTPRAIQILSQAVEKIDRERSPRHHLAAVHNMAVYLERVAETRAELEEALHWLRLATAEHENMPERMSLLKLRSLAASCTARLGGPNALPRARAELRAVREEFREQGAAAEEAVVLLREAALLVDTDAPGLPALAGEVFPLLGRLPKEDVAREALLRFHAACLGRTLTRAVLDELRRRIEHAG